MQNFFAVFFVRIIYLYLYIRDVHGRKEPSHSACSQLSAEQGETFEDAPAQFTPNAKTGGGEIKFREAEQAGKSSAVYEEFFHGYQNENIGLYDSDKEFNLEFESKVAKHLMSNEGLEGGKIPGASGMQDFIDNEFDFATPTSEEINSPKFQETYRKEAKYFKQYNENRNIGNKEYRKGTEQSPKSIEKMVKDTKNQKD